VARARSLEKLGTIDDKIGYPDWGRDVSGLKVTEGEHLRNVTALYRFELVHYFDRIFSGGQKLTHLTATS